VCVGEVQQNVTAGRTVIPNRATRGARNGGAVGAGMYTVCLKSKCTDFIVGNVQSNTAILSWPVGGLSSLLIYLVNINTYT
jgi:hypothetical protein